LKQWIESARDIGINSEEKDYYETNARTLVTVWGDTDQLTDYARRGWSGLISNYYAPRWNMFINEVTDCCIQHRTFDEKAFNDKCYRWGRKFIDLSMKIHYPQSGDGVARARALYRKYFSHREGPLQF
jgi:alpha-N-acetylglucosaminidase